MCVVRVSVGRSVGVTDGKGWSVRVSVSEGQRLSGWHSQSQKDIKREIEDCERESGERW